MRHKHHIIPKHRGGSNEPSNLVEISLTQHAMFHYCEWKLYGKRADYVAWKRLVGNLNDEELVHQKLIMGGENGGRKTKELGLGIFAMSKEKRSEVSRGAGKIGGKIGGLSRSEKKLNAARKNMLKADEVFMTSATNFVMPIVKVDKHKISNGKPGQITLSLRDEFINQI